MGLSEDDVRVLREGVEAGRKPKVMFTESAGQIAGQLGQVVGLTDPAESDDFVVVRFGRDELPFSPADLQVAPRGAKAAPRPVKVPEQAGPPPGPPILEDAPARRPAVEPAPVQAEPVTDSVSAAPPAPRKAAGRAAKPKAPAGLTVTLAYAEGEWLVSAAQGAKTLA